MVVSLRYFERNNDHGFVPVVDSNIVRQENIIDVEAQNRTQNLFVKKRIQQICTTGIISLRNFTVVICVLFLIYFLHCMYEILSRDDSFSAEKFIEPCNGTNITTLDEFKKMLSKLHGIYFLKHSIKYIADNNITNHTNEYLTERLENYTTTFDDLQYQFKQQKSSYFNCYKQNLKEDCDQEKQDLMNTKSLFDLIIFLAALTLDTVVHYYFNGKLEMVLKTKKLYREQRAICNKCRNFVNVLVASYNTDMAKKLYKLMNKKLNEINIATESLKEYSQHMKKRRIKILRAVSYIYIAQISCSLLTSASGFVMLYCISCDPTIDQIKEFPF